MIAPAVLLVTTGTAGVAPAASPEIAVDSVRIVGRASSGQPWRDRATEARRDQTPELMVVGLGRERRAGRWRRVVLIDGDDALELRGKGVARSQRRRWSAVGQVRSRWVLIEPHAFREEDRPAPNGTATPWHSNVSTEPGSFGRWLGYDEITYFETPLGPSATGADARRRPALARPSRRDEDLFGGLGTVRYRVEVELPDRRVLTTPGAAAVDGYGILPSVHRVSIRQDDTVLGHLTGYFLVPEVFGSAGAGVNHQTERFVGADCADVLTGAARRAGFGRVWHTSVSALGRYTRPVAGPALVDEQGRADRPLRGVRAGDIVRIDYGGSLSGKTPRSWDHVGLVWRDRSDPDGPSRGGPDGMLDGFDLIVHMGHPRLEIEPLREQAPARVDVLRWDPRRMGARGARPKPATDGR